MRSGLAGVQLRSQVYETMLPVDALAFTRIRGGQQTTLKVKLAVGGGKVLTVTVTEPLRVAPAESLTVRW